MAAAVAVLLPKACAAALPGGPLGAGAMLAWGCWRNDVWRGDGWTSGRVMAGGSHEEGRQRGEKGCICNRRCLESGVSCVLNKTAQHKCNGYFFFFPSSRDFYMFLNFAVVEYHRAVHSPGW